MSATPADSSAPRRRPAVCVVTLGCPKNEVDSDRMAATMATSFDLVGEPDEADVVVVNTCAFIEAATEESIGVVLEFAGDWKRARPDRALIVAGCMASRYGNDLAASMPEVDAFVPVADEATIASVVARALGSSPVDATAPARSPGDAPARLAPGPSAYLQVSDGCHRRCTFCTIPAIRGPYVSRPLDELVTEAAALVAGGAREIVLIGQDISSWGRDLGGDATLADLVRALARVDGLAWLRLMYVQPDGITPDLLEAMADEPVVCRYLDMPLQHASREVLRRMGRSGDAAEFARLIGVVRHLLPGVALRTTLIAGFPGESADDARRLEDFIEEAALDYVGVFPFSPEEGTTAVQLPDQVTKRTRVARAQRLRDRADAIGVERVARHIGEVLEVLVEGLDEDGDPYGRHRGQAPEIDGVVLLDREVARGELVMVEIVDSMGYDLVGRITA